ncbi:SDR family NAD(P)-dependent oxidoreductase [Amycolatopsis rhabdoformis]|uniref:SDR family NAD(P)-dependent oxidoreductase n=1 Tax=Amycolatopsis rhabdoformis TaxID=1448059 RepID=A0ABZ1I320_9PSEU|nr:SDR family NAD(P)-dependent oxidoreductase [Amycolatopsis rhabdoformis]WSE28767.1 SDR family NAD(P)-dependent oxidoreductase [Amycolatopsis rhabdoformis]
MSRTLLITGTSRGLGRALAVAALEAGHRVVATARNTADLEDLVSTYPAARAVALDVRDPQAAADAVQVALDAFGRLDGVINNAGYANVSSLEDTPLDDFRDQVETNLWGAVHVSRAALPVFRSQGGGHLVQISSVSGRLAPAAGLGPYVTAKFALEGFSEALALETASFGVRVTVVEAGSMATSLYSSMSTREPSPAYASALAPMLTAHATGQAPGVDPARAAEVILGLFDLAEPPLWLPLSGQAVDLIRPAEQRKLAELDRWEELSRSVDARG